MGARREARIVAFQAIYAWEDSHLPVNDICEFCWLIQKPIARDFAKLIIAGAIENLFEIDEAIKGHLENWSFDRLCKVDLAVLRMAVYSILFQTDIPASVTIDEAIEIAKKFGSTQSYKFVNGILDSIMKSNAEKNEER